MAVYPKPFIFFLISIFIFSLIPSSTAVPFILFYGLEQTCSTPKVETLRENLSMISGTQGYCIEIDSDLWESWTIPLMTQVDIACRKVKSMPALSEGYNIVALSQGNLVGRGVVEFCDDAPPVKKFIGLAGPHAGIADMPYCGSSAICKFVDNLLQLEVYSSLVQDNVAPSNFMKIPNDLTSYLEGCKFLPLLNNEIAMQRNPIYKQRFSSLEKLVLVMFESDTVLKPRETSWFGYYKNGSMTQVLPYSETQLYIEDWFGLKTLDEEGKIDYLSVPGEHLDITESVVKRIVPYFQD
ncbi:hypothetical protein V2J09_015285 [Rumex salicifolius]